MNLSPAAIAKHSPQRDAIIIGDARWNYRQLDDFSCDCAALLYARGLNQGDVVAILMSNSPEFLGCCWAAQRSGLYYLPIPNRLTADEIAYILADSGAKALVLGEGYDDVAAQAVDGIDGLQVFSTASVSHFTALNASFGEYPSPPAIEGGDMLYTSGTTGRPKGVKRPLTGEALGSDSRRVYRGETLFRFDRDTRFLSPAPLYHAAPLRFAMNLLRSGACVIGMKRFDADGALKLIEQERVTHSQWVPTMLSRLLALPDQTHNAYDLSSHRVAIHAGAPCPSETKRAMIKWWGPILHEYYSGTESVGFTHITSEEWLKKPGSVGRPFGCTVHVLDDAGNELPHGETGAVYFDGKGGLEYHGDAEKTRAAHDAWGRSTMGDIGHVDEDGFLFLTDRKHFTIISGGVNVYPSEIETALSTHREVRDCAVFGLPDADLGEVVAAVVETDPPVDPHNRQLAQALFETISRQLAGPKRPRLWRFDSVGRSETGKIAKAKLRDRFKAAGSMIDLRD